MPASTLTASSFPCIQHVFSFSLHGAKV